MSTIRQVLTTVGARPPYVIRPLGPGDLGWVVHRHGVIYSDEYGWDQRFEVLVARIVADFGDRDRAWIAELDGGPVGCVVCVRKEDDTAQSAPASRRLESSGARIGARLVDECIRFAKRSGYRRIVLWTNDVLVSARRIYQAAGFVLVDEEPHGQLRARPRRPDLGARPLT